MNRHRYLILLLIAATALVGCSDDKGSIDISVIPDDLDAGWSLDCPAALARQGTGSDTLEDMATGLYTVTWSEVPGYRTPSGESLTLESGEHLRFEGNYESMTRTADETMEAFEAAYSGRNLSDYGALLSADFVFVDTDGEYTDHDAELAISDKLFHEIAGQGGIIISDIHIAQMEPSGDWTPTPSNDPEFGSFVGSQYRIYLANIRFAISGQNLIYIVQGPVVFFTMNEGTVDQPSYMIIGIRDQTSFWARGTENHSWSAVKSLFE